MAKTKIFVFFLLLLVACNTSDKKTSTVTDSAKDKNINEVKPYPELVQQLITSVQQQPDSTGLRFKLAVALDSIGAYNEALHQMDTLLKKDSTNFGLWYANGEIAEDAKDTSRAMMSYAKAISIYASPNALLSLANLYAEKKNDKSLQITKQIKEMSLGREYDAHCEFITGVYYARTGNRSKALQYFDACIADNYTYMPAYIEKGLVYFDNKQYREALNIFTFASTVNALDSDPYYWEGRCYEQMNVKDSAALRFKQSLRLQDDTETRIALKRVGG